MHWHTTPPTRDLALYCRAMPTEDEVDAKAKSRSFFSCTCLSRERRLLFMLVLTLLFFGVELVVGSISKSNALVADAFHMLSDVLALTIAYISVRMSKKSWSKNTFGFARAEVLGALTNAVFLLALCFTILIDSIKRFVTPEHIENPWMVLIVGCIGLVINLLGLFMFHDAHHGHSHGGGGGHGHSHGGGGHGHSHAPPPKKPELETISSTVPSGLTAVVVSDGHSHSHSNKTAEAFSPPQLNFRGVFLHVLADALGSVVVIVSALIVQFAKGWSFSIYVDPTLSILLVIIIVCSTVPLLLMSANVLLQSVPDHLAVDDMKERLVREFPAIINVHEFHVWQLVATRIVASVHVQLSEETQHSLEEHMRLVKQMKGFFHREGIHSTTIQMEYSSRHMTPANDACVVPCPPLGTTTMSRLGRADCSEDQCCGLRSSRRRRTNSSNGSVRSGGGNSSSNGHRQRTASSSTSVSTDSRGAAFDRSHSQSVCSVPSVTVVTPTM